MKTLTVLLLLTMLAPFSFSQTQSVRDLSPSNCPISVTGTVSFSAPHAPASIVAHNRTSKEVLALVATILITAPDGAPVNTVLEHEYFFREDHITGSGADFEIVSGHLDVPVSQSEYVLTPDGKKTAVKYPPPHPPEATLVFVQFEDGSSWGDEKAGQAMIAERPSVMAYLKKLLTANGESGDVGVTSVLNWEPPEGTSGGSLRAIRHVLRQTKDQAGTQFMVDLVRQKIIAAEARQAKLML